MYDGPTDGEREELLALREHLDTDGAQIVRNLAGACHACANYFNVGILRVQGQASSADQDMALGIAVLALERAGYELKVAV